MTAKEYLSQAYRLDQRAASKAEQIFQLRGLATQATATMSNMPRNASPNPHRMEGIIVKIVDLENDLNADIDRLLDLKREIVKVIDAVENPDQQLLLSLRYLNFKSWEQIAVTLGYSMVYTFQLHKKALENVKVPESA